MGFLDILSSIAGSVMESAQKQQQETLRRAGKQMDDYEKKLGNAEGRSGSMSYEQQMKIKEAREKLERNKEILASKGHATSTYSTKNKIGNHTLDEWDSRWVCIGPLATASLSQYNKCVGLYRHVVHGKTMYVGRAVELNNGGFRKRLSDYRRDSDSARKHGSGKKINEHLNDITTYILVVGDSESAIEITKKLEGLMIGKYSPAWNVMLNI